LTTACDIEQAEATFMPTFIQLGVPRDITDTLAHRGVITPFPIQEATIADTMAGRDLCGRAPTGSGKTLAFSIPLAVNGPPSAPRRPGALVLVPTRELAAQVAGELRPLAELRGRCVATFYGGTNIAGDQRSLRRGVDIAIACPGRLADLVRRGDADLRAVRIVVVDEADRMADMGFLPQVKQLLDQTAADRQTMLFSATLDGDVDALIRGYQRDPVRHELATRADDCGDVRHFFWHAAADKRVSIARDIVVAATSAIVFTRTKHAADRVAKQLNRQGVRAAVIHSNRSQNQRERALADFSKGRVAALVATDVAARGIHVDNVGVVIHFDPPASGKDYVHRSGRTGRAGADGLVVTLVPPDKVGDVKSLQRTLAIRQHVENVALNRLTDGAVSGVRPDQPDMDHQVQPRPSERGQQSHHNEHGRSGQRHRLNSPKPKRRNSRRRSRSAVARPAQPKTAVATAVPIRSAGVPR
jgi:superfamily II DNA/RNA helicase